MANTALLNNIDHQNLKIITRRGAEFGDSINQVAVFPTEFIDLQREYPILFRRNEDGKYLCVVLLGLDKDENLYLTDEGWQARYIPAILERGPFMIGFQDQDIDGEIRREPVIHVDIDHPRVNEAEGQPVFQPHGGTTPYLDHVSRVLRRMNQGHELQDDMFAAFEKADLIEEVSMDVRLDENTSYKVPDVFTISEEKLAALDGETLAALHAKDYLRLAFLVLASLPNVNRLIHEKNERMRKA